MADLTLKGNPIHSVGQLPDVGASAPSFHLVGQDLGDVRLADFAGHKVVLNIVPSVDTGTCAQSARTFNEKASSVEGTKILTISCDLPFAMGRFCAAEGLEDVIMLSGFRGEDFGNDYGVTFVDGPLEGLYSRAVVVLNEAHEVVYAQQVTEIVDEPDYDAALEALA